MLDSFALGARHGLDADHVAAISELAAGERGGIRGLVAGARYALGHSAVVLVIGFAGGHAGIEVPRWLIGLTLIGLGVWSAVRLRVAGHVHEHAHATAEGVIRHSHRHHHAIGVGVLHGLGGAPSGVFAGSRGGVGLAAFVVGLLIVNGALGVLAGATTKLSLLAWLGIAGGTTYGALLVASA
ncbi:MAG: hypothetical protein ACOYXM_15715 [Actinomycetota bacterium]